MSKESKYYHSTVIVNDYNFNKIEITSDEYKNFKKISIKFNNSSDVDEKKQLAKLLPNKMFAYCRYCGDIIINSNFRITVKPTYIQLTTPSVYCREIDGNKYYLSCCKKCLYKHFNNELPKSDKYLFMKANKYGQYSFGYSDNEFYKICSATTAVTKKSLIKKWGEELGILKWNEYRNKQSIKNTFEYKKQKYNWNETDFNNFNKSRGITLNNLIKKYGEDLGIKKYNEYLYKQHITKSYQYMVEKYGLQKANDINKSKAITLKNFIKKYGDIEGEKRYKLIMNKMPKFYSKISQECFNKIDIFLSNKYTTYYATKNTEFGINLNGTYIFLDYYIKELKICIEFNGTVFHADKRIYNENDKPNPFNKQITAKEIWEYDNNRYSQLNNIGIKTYVIWEIDYNESFDAYNYIINILNIKL